MNPPNIPPAFPVGPCQFWVDKTEQYDAVFSHIGQMQGMTLRDYFAAAALQGVLACPDSDGTFKEFSAVAYKHADAMLAEREKGQQ